MEQNRESLNRAYTHTQQQIFDKGAKGKLAEKILFQKMMLKQLYIHIKD